MSLSSACASLPKFDLIMSSCGDDVKGGGGIDGSMMETGSRRCKLQLKISPSALDFHPKTLTFVVRSNPQV